MTDTSGPRGKLVAIVGATASGKTGAAIEIARHVPAEVVSADSRQVRREMRIGTAAPAAEELAAVPHHLVWTITPDAPWSLAEFLACARTAIEGAWARGRLPLLVGGTGQYVWALLEGWQVPEVPANPELRAQLEALAGEPGGPEALRARLEAIDPASAVRIAPQNLRRIIRAIEIVETTDGPVRPLERRAPDFDWHVIGLEWPRDELHRRADARAAAMYEAGLIEETRRLLERYGPQLPALTTIGYAEAVRVIRGEWTVAQALERTCIETHRLIRMQGAWFASGDPRIEWVPGAHLDAAVAAVGRFLEAGPPAGV
ncbi:MAG: tRNA (adenosine(37)-N6)-dimethylallyltransferase MiaA [Dehalococcoidia bacterium]|nr:tRNA (adenosine(37)-N6)-dimethylallyltransferase MiaA [Dehalococcoidia bacterium]